MAPAWRCWDARSPRPMKNAAGVPRLQHARKREEPAAKWSESSNDAARIHKRSLLSSSRESRGGQILGAERAWIAAASGGESYELRPRNLCGRLPAFDEADGAANLTVRDSSRPAPSEEVLTSLSHSTRIRYVARLTAPQVQSPAARRAEARSAAFPQAGARSPIDLVASYYPDNTSA